MTDKRSRAGAKRRGAREPAPGVGGAGEWGKTLADDAGALRSVLDGMAEAVVVADAAGRLVYFNRAAEKLHGIGLTGEPAEGWGKRYGIFLEDGITPCPAEEVPLARAIRGEGPDHVGLYVRRPDGAGCLVEVTGRPIRAGRGGAVLGGVVVFADVSWRKEAERRLRESQDRLRRTLDGLLEGCMVIGFDWTYLFVNEAAAAHGHQKREAIIGRTMQEVYPEIERSAVFAAYRRCMEERTPQRFESEYVFSDGTTGWYEFSVEPVPEGIFVLSLDISERKRAEERLRSSSEYARGLIEASLDPLVTISSEGKITDVNAATEAATGVPRSGLIGSDFCDYFTEPGKARAGYQAVFAQGLVRDYPLTIRHQSGITMDVLYNATVYRNARGEVEGVFAAARDVTERLRLEQQLRQAQKMDALGQLAGGIAHDFNNLLTVIHANVGLLEAELPDDAGVQQELRDLQRAATRGRETVRKLLGFSRQETLALISADLGLLVADVVETLRRVLPETVEIRFTTAASLPAVRADRGSIEQILINLATNARDAMPQGGTLAIDIAPWDRDALQAAPRPDVIPGRYVKVTVSDTGQGMDEHTLRRAYEPFFTSKPVGQGTGLGIPLVYGLMRQHGGQLHIASELGRGTTVSLLFPAAEGPAAAESVPQRRKQFERRGCETILVVEDEEDLRRVACRILSRYGYRTLAAANGEEALAAYREHRGSIDLIFTDLVMPKLGGLALLERVREDDPGVRFLVASGYTSGEARGAGMQAGVPFINKPWTLPDLLERVRNVLDAPLSERSESGKP